jgi:acyl-coenzyme A thioesterase PaaI-like protein
MTAETAAAPSTTGVIADDVDHPGHRARLAGRVGLIAAVRELMLAAATVSDDVPSADLDGTATRIRALAAELGPSTGRIHRRPSQEVTRTLDGFRLGSLNPLSVPATVRVRRPGSVVADLEPDALAEGPPDRMHGGAIAWLFDNIMGMALQSLDLRCATGTLTLRFVAPTPLDAGLRMTAEADQPQGRKVTVRAALHDDAGAPTVHGEGLFILLREGERL